MPVTLGICKCTVSIAIERRRPLRPPASPPCISVSRAIRTSPKSKRRRSNCWPTGKTKNQSSGTVCSDYRISFTSPMRCISDRGWTASTVMAMSSKRRPHPGRRVLRWDGACPVTQRVGPLVIVGPVINKRPDGAAPLGLAVPDPADGRYRQTKEPRT